MSRSVDLWTTASQMSDAAWLRSFTEQELEHVRAEALGSREAFEDFVAPKSVVLLCSSDEYGSDEPKTGGKRARKDKVGGFTGLVSFSLLALTTSAPFFDHRARLTRAV
jgi:hypothetical protein